MATAQLPEDYVRKSYLRMRRAIGILGILLPVPLLVGSWLHTDCVGVQDSISHYYYTYSGDLFVGTLSAVGLFLITYKGKRRIEDIATNFAGLCALLVAFLPTTLNDNVNCRILDLPDNPIRTTAHLVSAALFFVTL